MRSSWPEPRTFRSFLGVAQEVEGPPVLVCKHGRLVSRVIAPRLQPRNRKKRLLLFTPSCTSFPVFSSLEFKHPLFFIFLCDHLRLHNSRHPPLLILTRFVSNVCRMKCKTPLSETSSATCQSQLSPLTANFQNFQDIVLQ